MPLEPKTRTFAEIYESQGHFAEALEIYIDLLKESQLDTSLTDIIKRLQSAIIEEKNSKRRRMEAQISALETFLKQAYIYKSGRA